MFFSNKWNYTYIPSTRLYPIRVAPALSVGTVISSLNVILKLNAANFMAVLK